MSLQGTMHVCLVCLKSLNQPDKAYHNKCAKILFGSTIVPKLAVDPSKLHLLGLEMAGKVTLSGVQKKIVLTQVDKTTLTVSATGEGAGRAYILKPDSGTYPELAVNEQLCSQLAKAAGLTIPDSGLVRLADGQLAFLSKRFDRTLDGRKIPVEDFCQLADLLPKDKYEGSVERCVKLIKEFSTQSALDGLKFFRTVLFSWWIGNNDLHLKNLSLLRNRGRVAMSPIYDLVSVELKLVLPKSQMAMTLAGKRSNIKTRDWLYLAQLCDIPFEMVARDVNAMIGSAEEGFHLIRNAPMSIEMKCEFAGHYVDRIEALRQVAIEADAGSKRRAKAQRAPVEPLAEDVSSVALKVAEGLRALGAKEARGPLSRQLEELEWLGRGAGPLFREDGPWQQDPARAGSAFLNFLRLKSIAQFLWDAKDLNVPSIGQFVQTRLTKGITPGQPGDRLFELEVAAALHACIPGQVSMETKPGEADIQIAQPDGVDFAVECKRPAKLESLVSNVIKGVEQVGSQPGAIVVSLDKIIKLPWIVRETYQECRAYAVEQINALITQDLRAKILNALPQEPGSGPVLPQQANGVIITAMFGISWSIPGHNSRGMLHHFEALTIAPEGAPGQTVDQCIAHFLRFGFNRALKR